MEAPRGSLHHVELQVLDDAIGGAAYDWLLARLGYGPMERWATGRSWQLGGTYIVLERAGRAMQHDRRGSGVNHLAFNAGARSDVDRIWDEAPAHGWTRLYVDRHPWAGGPGHYAAYLENAERSKVELVASEDADDG
ncbi:VOC family protein [Arenivirga flava]|uniref:Glyoxalase n=1 Tax=Arenivirga flava TaxID=1930060 RepID=A0AA37UEZ1_9MICO|nr:VOC family protein [Arenivirga flava]GMA29004.1 hypothetical protein GCM10025874_22570 [Arenivirga flava]